MLSLRVTVQPLSTQQRQKSLGLWKDMMVSNILLSFKYASFNLYVAHCYNVI